MNLKQKIWIGNLDRRITFREADEVQSTSGAMSETWSDFAICWASVDSTPKGTGEKFTIDREMVINRQFFIIRYRTDINEKMRISFESNEYDILSIQELPGTRLTWLQIEAEHRK